MAVSIVTEPAAVGFARKPNRIEWVFSTDKYLVTAGVKHVVDFGFDAKMPNGETLTLRFNHLELIFTAVAVPDDSGYQLPDLTHVGTLAQYMQELVDLFNANFEIHAYYTVSYVGLNGGFETIKFTARDIGEPWLIDFDTTAVNTLQNVVVLGANNVYNDNFKLLVDVMAEELPGSGTYEQAARLDQVPDDNNECFFDVAPILLPYLDDYLRDIPPYNSGSIFRLTRSSWKYKLAVTERYGDPAVHKKVTETAVKVALRAGLDYLHFPNNTWYADLANNEMFLNNRISNTLKVTDEQHEYLHYLVWDAGTTEVLLRVKINYTDLSFTEITKETYVGVAQHDLLCIPAGLKQLGLELINPGKTIKDYYIYLWNQAEVTISESRFYVPVTKEVLHTRYFLFMNSLGGIDTLRAEGMREDEWKIKRQTLNAILDTNYDTKLGQQVDYDAELTYQFEVSAGYRSKAEVYYLRELLLSQGWAAEIDLENERYLPIRITTDNVDVYKDEDHLYRLRFDYEYNWKDMVVTGPEVSRFYAGNGAGGGAQ